jgi:TDG/mug DNA glycosylase family protein
VRTLPDHVAEGLSVLFVGLNPSIYAAQHGHYYARPTNRFWPALSRSRLSLEARQGLGVERLRPEHDAALLRFGFGFTDVVKQPTVGIADLAKDAWPHGVGQLRRRLARCQPRIACFQGLTGFDAFLRHGLGERRPVQAGPQPERIGNTAVFVVPSPSGANAHANIAILAGWYDRLWEHLQVVDTLMRSAAMPDQQM